MVDFNLHGPDTVLLGGEVRLSQTRVHQQQAYDPVGDRVYATQVIQNGRVLADETEPPPDGYRDAHGDLAINQVDTNGSATGVMYVRGFGHGAGLGVENIGGVVWLWLEYDAPMAEIGSNAYGTKIARIPWADGAILDVGDPEVEVYDPHPGGDHITPAVDTTHGRCAVLAQVDGTYRFYVYDLEAFKAREFEPLVTVERQHAEQWQAWCLYGDRLYQFTGYSRRDAYFTVYDITSGEVVQRVLNDRHAELEYREAESISVWEMSAGPQLVYGFATRDPSPRYMALYGISAAPQPEPGLTARTVTDPQPGIQVTATLNDPETVRTWTLYRIVGGREQQLATGPGQNLPAGGWLDDAPPACIPVVYRLAVRRTSGAEESYEAPPVTYVPPGGCGSSSGPVAAQPNTLGCAQTYTAVIHWRGGAQPYTVLDRLTAVSWGRTINDISEASVTVALGDLSAECQEQLCGRVNAEGEIEGGVHPWVHELSIYRDSDLHRPVWQGPVVRPRYRRDAVIIEAQDVFVYLDHVVNTFRVTYTSGTADERGRMRAPITYIAENHIRLNLAESSLSVPPDWCRILPVLVRRDGNLPTIKVEKDGSSNATVWTQYLGDILREWTKRGLTWTTVGRTLLLRGYGDSTARAAARLTLDHIAGDVEVLKDGLAGATYAFATSQQGRDISDGRTLGTGRTGTAYGRLDTLTTIQEEDATDADLRAAARAELAGRYPVPVTVEVPDSAQLTPDAPVTLDRLVPGERLDVIAHTLCLPLEQGFLLSDVDVTWQDGVEQVGIGLIPLGDVDEELSS